MEGPRQARSATNGRTTLRHVSLGTDASPEPAACPTQADGLEITEVADGLVIYKREPEQVHYLNRTASVVFELCTGEHSLTQIAALLGEAFGLAEPPVAEVQACLEQLRSLGVVR
jgi:hypothetical protein